MTAPEHPDHDEAFEAYLQRRSELSRQLREHDSLEPPEELDRIVLCRARQAIRDRESPPVYHSPRWALPVALAATIVVTLSVVLSMTESLYTSPSTAPPMADSEARSEAASAEVTAAANEMARQPAAAPRDAQEEVASAPTTPARRARESAPVAMRPEPLTAEKDAVRAFSPAPPIAVEARAEPETWLQWIEELRRRGEHERAEQEMEQFRRTFPDYRAPADTGPAR